jgi:superfamily II DNA/RNA helicase
MTSEFRALGVPAALVAALGRRGIAQPFPVQSAAIPEALAAHDLAVRAPTGSGKTLAFGLPVLMRVEQAEPRRPRALVLSPTRELAQQIARDLRPFAKVVDRRVLAVYGGTSVPAQRRELQRGVDVVVACPGRLLDLVEQRILDLSEVDLVVIDEADRMADMGFLPPVRQALDLTAPHRQVLLFSATLDGDVAALVRDYQHDPVDIAMDHDDGRMSAADHVFHTVDRAARPTLLAEMLDDATRTIVFCRTRHGVDRLTKSLSRSKVRAVAIHGGHTQSRRTRALTDFTNGRAQVLIATDVAARGIHVDGIDQVVHFDLAEDAKAYVHRSGRTARAGAGGRVVTFVTHEDAAQAARMRRELGLAPPSRGTPRRSRPQPARQRRRKTTTSRTGEARGSKGGRP